MNKDPRFLRRLDINNVIDEVLIGNTIKRQYKRLNRLILLPYAFSFLTGFIFTYYFPDQLLGVMIGSGLCLLIMIVESRMTEQKLRYIVKRTIQVLGNQGYQWDINMERMIDVMKPIWKYLSGR